jgi:hypothetical protein
MTETAQIKLGVNIYSGGSIEDTCEILDFYW